MSKRMKAHTTRVVDEVLRISDQFRQTNAKKNHIANVVVDTEDDTDAVALVVEEFASNNDNA